MLGGVQGRVRTAHERVEAVSARLRRGQADADTDAQARRRRDGEVRDGPADQVGPRRRIREIREQTGEFLSAHAAEDRAGRHQGTGGLAEGHEHGVTDGMAMGVVDALEVIEVEKKQGRVRGAPAQERLGLRHEGAPVGDPRQRVHGGGEALKVLGPLLGQGHEYEGEGQGQHHPEAGQDGEGGRRQERDIPEVGSLQDRHGNPHGIHEAIHHEENRGRIARDQGLGSPVPDQRRRGEAEAARQSRRQDDAGGQGREEVRHQAGGAP